MTEPTSTSASQERCTLPPEKVFSIQIGTQLFRLSGASIASDAPSYFSRFFEAQIAQNNGNSNGEAGLRTLYIDRDPGTFGDIVLHLQGYHVCPKDSSQFVRLFADAQFYSLPRLTSQLFASDIFIQIGDRHFQIPRDIFSSPGNTPNFFSLGFAAFFASPTEVFPGLDREGLLRPPAIEPPSVPSRSGEVFAELLHMLRGYEVEIRSEEHRGMLLRDCRYFNLRGLEQRLIPHDVSHNPGTQQWEILLRLGDVRVSNVGIARWRDSIGGRPTSQYFTTYARPFIDEDPRTLMLETGRDGAIIDMARRRVQFDEGPVSQQMAGLLEQVHAKTRAHLKPGEECPASDALSFLSDGQCRVDVDIYHTTDLTIDGERIHEPGCYWDEMAHIEAEGGPPAKRRRQGALDGNDEARGWWFVRRAQWQVVARKRPDGLALSLQAVKLEVCTSESQFNRTRGFLGG